MSDGYLRVCHTSFPPVATLMCQVDILQRPLLVNEGTQHPADQADQEGTKHSRPKPGNIKTRYNPGGHLQHEGINQEGEKTKAQYIDGEG